MNEMMIRQDDGRDMTAGDALRTIAETLVRFSDGVDMMKAEMATMADTIRAISHKVDQMEKTVDMLLTVSPSQVKSLNKDIRDRAGSLAADWGLPETGKKSIAAVISKHLKLEAGVRRIDEIPKSMYGFFRDYVRDWEDYTEMKQIEGRWIGK